MKVLFLTIKNNGMSARWRVQQLLPGLRKHGIEGTMEAIPSGAFAKLAMAKKASEYDAVVLQKRVFPRIVAMRLRKYAPRLIYDFDEPVMFKRTEAGVVASTTRERRFRRTVRLADAVFASNEHFANLALPYAGDAGSVHVMPNAIDLDHWKPLNGDKPKHDGIVIGWFGAAGNLPHLDLVAQPIMRLTRRHENLKLRIVCARSIHLPGVPMEHIEVPQEQEPREVGSFDIAVAPMVEDSYTRGRISAKLLTYFSAGLPVVASDVPANRDIVKHGENGFLCGTLTQWEESLEALIENPGLRAEMGTRARRTAEREHDLAGVVDQYAELLQRIVKGELVSQGS